VNTTKLLQLGSEFAETQWKRGNLFIARVLVGWLLEQRSAMARVGEQSTKQNKTKLSPPQP